MESSKQKSGVARLLQIAGSKKRLLLLSAVLSIVHAILNMIPYILTFYIIKALVQPPPDTGLIYYYLKWAALAAVISYAFLYAAGMASHIAAFNILYMLRKQMAERIGLLPLGFINQYNSGALKKIMADDIERIENFIAHSLPDFVKGAGLPLITLGYLFTVDWRLALISCFPIVFLAVMIPILFNKSRMSLLTAYHRSLEDMNAGIVEFVRAMPVMKIFGQTASGFKRYSDAVYTFNDMVMQYIKSSSPPYGVFISFISNASLPVLALSFYLYFSGGITLPVVFLFLILGVGYIRPLFALSNLGSQISVINHGVKRLDEILFSAEQQSVGAAVLRDDHSIAFNNVSFGYTPEMQVLRDVSFEVPQGSITALVGPSGSGKSTIAQLVSRFWDVSSGVITIGGIDVTQVRPELLMEHVSFVFQDSFMFQQTIYENIRMGMERSREEVITAAEAAQCHAFISRLPDGYDTRWGESGVHLSGGEQQRIQLARAVLKNAPILILDEATAFSDPENEFLIQQAFSRLIRDKTVLVIAHRLSTVMDSDQIVVMEGGRVAAKGRHDELVQNCSLYQHMWHAHTRAKEFAL